MPAVFDQRPMFVIHSGQTGVERGAHRGARMLGCRVAGFCTTSHRDELGPIPEDIATALTPCLHAGPRSALEANVAIATALIVIVPERRRLAAVTGIPVVLRQARAANVPFQVADPATSPEQLGAWLAGLPATSSSIRCMITGPRETRWSDGDRTARRLVTGLITAASHRDAIIPASFRAQRA